MNPKKQIDWSGIETEYRSGQLSVREIGRIFKVSHVAIVKKASAEKWERNLASRVRQLVTKKLVTTEVTKPHASEDEIVEEAANRGVAIITSHRKDIARLRNLEQSLLNELEGIDEEGKPKPPKKLYITQYQGDIVEKEVGLTVTERAGALRDLAKVQQTRITLERQAFNLNDQPPDPGDGSKGFIYEHFLAALIFEKRKFATSKEAPILPTDGTKEFSDAIQK